MTALLLLLLVCASRAQIYLSAFGNDNNNGVTPANAVATLGRAYNLASAQNVNNATIIMAAGVIPLNQFTFYKGTVTLIGAGSTGNAANFKFSCSPGDTLTTNAQTTNIVGVSFDSCDNAITIYSPSAKAFLGLTNVVFDKTANALLIKDAASTVNVTSSRFSNKAVTMSRATYFWDANVYFYNSQFTTTAAGTIIDTANADASSSHVVTGSIVIEGSLFLATAPVTNVWVRDSFGPVAIADSTFLGPANAKGCSVRLDNVKSQITNTVFESHSGSPALCIVGGTSSVINSEFNGNQGNSSASGAALPGAAIYASGATLAVSTTKFKSNKFDGDGAGIHCESTRLTVGSSTFAYNSVTGASAACSSLSCTVVSFNNTFYRNSDRSQTNSCNLQ